MLRKIRILEYLVLLLVVTSLGYGQNISNNWYQNVMSRSTASVITSNAKVRLQDALQRLENEYNVSFMYKSGLLIGYYVKPTVQFTNSLGEKLHYLLDPLDLKFYRLNKHTVIIESGQSIKHVAKSRIAIHHVNGNVTDSKDGSRLPGVNVVVKGTTHGTSTDKNGKYDLDVSSPLDTLVFSYIGYKTQEIPIRSRKTINVQMVSKTIQGKEMVVVGYKSVANKNLADAVSTVNVGDLQNVPASTILDNLAGKVPGMQDIVRTGLPGASGGGLVIRGNTNLSAASDVSGLSSPLYIVDGVPMSLQDFAGFNVTQNDFFATLDPNNIKSITVLRDVAATAIYGARGSNGVVIIQTKQGVKGKTRVSFSSKNGVVFQPSKIPVYIGQAERIEKVKLINQSLKTLFGNQPEIDIRNGLAVKGYLFPPVLTNYNNPYYNNAYDYQSMFYQPGFNQQYNLALRGGTISNSYRVGLGYYNEKGILKGTNFNRFTLNANLTSDISSIVHNVLTTRLVYMNRLGGGNSYLKTLPTSPTNLLSSLYYRTPEELSLLKGQLGNTEQSNKTYLGTVSEELRLKFSKNLTMDNQGSVQANFGRKSYFVPSYASTNGFSELQDANNNNFILSAHSTLDYLKTLGEFQIAALGGTELNINRLSMFQLSAENGPSNHLQVVQGYQNDNITGYSDNVVSNMFSYFTDVSLKFKDRYKIEGVLRRDGSSRFGSNNKWGTFPSLKAFWIFTNEPWMHSLNSVLSFGKIRVSYGIAGQMASDPLLQYNSFISINNIGSGINNIYADKMNTTTYGGEGAVVPDFNKIANRSLSWSKTNEVDYGLDLHLFQHRIYISSDYYSRYISGEVFPSMLAPSMGYNSISSNLVDMISNGWETNVTGYLFPRSNDFQWSWTLNLAQNKTVVAKLGNGGRDYINGDYAFVENQPAFQYYTYNYLGTLQNTKDLPVDPMTGQYINYLWADAGLALNEQGKIFPGMPLFTDVNGDYQIDGGDYGYDKEIIQGKSPQPKIYGGLGTQVKYKNLNLNIHSSFSFGSWIYDTYLHDMLSHYDSATDFFTYALYKLPNIHFWNQRGSQAYYPMRYINYSGGGSARSFRNSSMFLERGDYWSIDNITLSYNLPVRITDRIGVRGINIYTTMRNVYMWKRSHVPDPRMITKEGYYNGQGYPLSRSMVIGTKINF